MHNQKHTEEAKAKIKEKQTAWRKTQSYRDFVERQRARGKKSSTKFKKGHKIHELHPELKEKIKPYQHGEKHWNWQGGLSSEATRIRGSKEYIEWRKAVFARDDYTCQECGKRGCYIEAHHFKIPFCYLLKNKMYKEMFDISYGQTLCRKCHDKTKLFFKKYYEKHR